MEPALLTAAAAGVVAGLAASALPGVHVNALSAATLALLPGLGPAGSAFLLAAFAASPFGQALAATFVGGTGEDDALQALPAHRLAAQGRAMEAVALQAWGAFAGLALGLLLCAPLAWGFAAAEPLLAAHLGALLVLVIVLLAVAHPPRPPVHRRWVVVPWRGHGARTLEGVLERDPHGWRLGRRRLADPHSLLATRDLGERVAVRAEPSWSPGPLSPAAGALLALGVVLLAGAVGLAAGRLGVASPLGLPASMLLPLLAGLFALPAALDGLRAEEARATPRRSRPRVPRGFLARHAAPGAAVSSLEGLLPGVSTSHVALLLPRVREPEAQLVRLAAMNGGAVAFTLLAWHVLGKPRSGSLLAAQAYAPAAPWTALPEVLREAALVLACAGAACLLVRVAAAPLAAVPARRLALAGLLLVLGSVAAFTGWRGLCILGAAGLVGRLPPRLRVRRSLLMGAVLVPAALRALGLVT